MSCFGFIVFSYFLRRVSHYLANATFQAPATSVQPCLDVYPPPQVLQIVGRLCHLVLAFPYVGDIANGRATSLHRHYSASSLLRARPTPSRLWPTSRFRRLYGLPCSGDFSLGRGRSLQFLSMSLSPCCRFP